MRRFSQLLSLGFVLLVNACMADVEPPSNDPAIPVVSYDGESMTRVSVSLTGSFTARNPEIVEYGFDLAEGSFSGGAAKTVLAERTEDGSFTSVATIEPGKHYVVKSWFSNGKQKKYSQEKAISAPLTSAATLTDVRLENGRLVASVVDNGGREINEFGFVGGETDDAREIKRNRKYPATRSDNVSFSLELSSFAAGKTYYFLAYAENSDNPSQDIYGYSRNALEVTIAESDIVEFEDAAFEAYLVSHFDTSGDGKMSYSEMKVITDIDVKTDGISSVKEIWLMPDLKRLSVSGSIPGVGLLTRLDISGNTHLTAIDCDNNRLDSLIIDKNPSLDSLSCAGNRLEALSVSGNDQLRYLNISSNQLLGIDVSGNQSLTHLDVSNNEDIAFLDVTNNILLDSLFCNNLQLRSLNVSKNAGLKFFDCGNNLLEELDISLNPSLQWLRCSDNSLKGQDVSKNLALQYMDITNNPIDTIFLYATQRIPTLNRPDNTKLFYLIDRLAFSSDTMIIQVGATQTLQAEIVPKDAIDKSITWVSNDDNVATVSSTGEIKGVSINNCTITAFCGGQSATCQIIVNPVPVSEIRLDQTECSILLEGSLNLKASVLPENASDKTVTWESSDPSIASVSSDGTITTHQLGTCIITAHAGDKEARCQVTVDPISVSNIRLDRSSSVILIGSTLTLQATVEPENATYKTVTWSSSDERIATVSNEGMITAVSLGKCTISAQSGEKVATCEVTVNPIPVESIAIEPTSCSITIGSEKSLSVTVLPENATDKSVSWSSSNERVAAVSKDGVVTAVGVGSCDIIARAGDKESTCRVTVNPIPVTSIVLDPTECSILVGGAVSLSATVSPRNATYRSITWSSSDNEIASVEEGEVYGVSVGTCIITAMCGDQQATCRVTVNPVPVSNVSISPTSCEIVAGSTRTFSATVSPDNATDKTVIWSTDNASVATVSDGVVTAVSPGNCTISASAGNKSAGCQVSVIAATVPVTSVSVSPSILSMTVGGTSTISATVSPGDATDQTVTWTSDDDAVATVTDGVITAVSAGACNVIASCGGKSANCRVIVSPATIPVTSVSITPPSCSITVGDTRTLVATVLPENATDKNVIWSSDDDLIAKVVEGQVTALSVGSCTITASCGVKSASCKVDVLSSEDPSIAVFPSSIAFDSSGGSETISVTSSGPWTATAVNLTGVVLSDYSGTGDAQVMVTVSENNETALAGNIVFTLTETGDVATLQVTQEVSDYGYSPNLITIPALGSLLLDDFDLLIKPAGTNGEWIYNVYYKSSWLYVIDPETGQHLQGGAYYGQKAVKLKAEPNPNMAERQGFLEIFFYREGQQLASKRLYVTQTGEPYYVGVIHDFVNEEQVLDFQFNDEENYATVRRINHETGTYSVFLDIICQTNDQSAVIGLDDYSEVGWFPLRDLFYDEPHVTVGSSVATSRTASVRARENWSDQAITSRSFFPGLVVGAVDADRKTIPLVVMHRNGTYEKIPTEADASGHARLRIVASAGESVERTLQVSWTTRGPVLPTSSVDLQGGGRYTTSFLGYGRESNQLCFPIQSNMFWRVAQVNENDNYLVLKDGNWEDSPTVFNDCEISYWLAPNGSMAAGGNDIIYPKVTANTTGTDRVITLAVFTGEIVSNRIQGQILKVLTIPQKGYVWLVDAGMGGGSRIEFSAVGGSVNVDIIQDPIRSGSFSVTLFDTAVGEGNAPDWVMASYNSATGQITVTAETNTTGSVRNAYGTVLNHYNNEEQHFWIYQGIQSL